MGSHASNADRGTQGQGESGRRELHFSFSFSSIFSNKTTNKTHEKETQGIDNQIDCSRNLIYNNNINGVRCLPEEQINTMQQFQWMFFDWVYCVMT